MANEKVEKVLAGCLDNLPDMDLTSILLFFSSTFTDMSVERNYLMQNAVPRLRMYCLQRALDFQVIDMRWGVRDEASVDHSTTDIVLQQIKLCQKLSKGPNFVAFLGDRYGSRILQKHIEELEFKLLHRIALKLKHDVGLLDKWYLKNENVIPTEYLLRPITDIYPHYSNSDPGKENLQQQAKNDWNSTNEKLLLILRSAADQAYLEKLITKECRQKYFYSVTESEVEKGILEYPLYKEKVLCYNRAFADINIEDEKAGRFVDMQNGKLDDEAAELRMRLKVARVFPLLTPDQIRKDHLYWTPVGVDVNNDQHSQYLKELCEDFEKKIKKMIDESCSDSKAMAGSIKFLMFKEILHHLHFSMDKIKQFCGREELLEDIKTQMMVYHGEEISFDNETKENELQSKENELNDQVNELRELEAAYWEEQKSLKEHLNSLGVIYCHGDEDLDIESDPNRNLKAELLNVPEMKHYSRPIVLFGESGSGKTAVMAKIACEAREWFRGSVVVVRFFGTSPSASLIRTTIAGMCSQIHFMYKVQVPSGVDLEFDFDYLQKYFVSLLWKINTESKPLVIILDSVDQLLPNDYAHMLYWLPLKLPPNVHMIISMLPKVKNCLKNMKQLMPFSKQYIEVPPLPIDTADHIITTMLHSQNRRLTKPQRRFVLECFLSCSYPLYLKLLIDESLSWTSNTVITDLDPGKDINGAINKIFDRLEKHHGSITVAKFCGYLGVSKEGLTEAEIEDILSLDDEVLQDTYIFHLPPDPKHIRVPTSIRTQMIVDLKEYLVKQMSGGWTVINWYHRQFKQATSERYIQKTVKPKLHKVLAEYFMGTWFNQVKPLELFKRKKGSYPNNTRLVPPQPICFGEMAGKKGYNTRKLVELPYHLTKAKQFEMFCTEVACNFEFLLVKCKILNVSTLIQDLREAISEMDDSGMIDKQEVYNDIHTVYDCLMFGCNQIRKDANTLGTLLIAQLGPECSNSSCIQKLIADAKQWYMDTDIPLLVPVFRSLPSPGGVQQGRIEVDTFLRGEGRDFKNTLALNMEKKHLYVIQPESRSLVDYLKVFDLNAEATCFMTRRLKAKMNTIAYLPQYGCLQLTTEKGLDQVYDIPPENAVKFQHEPESITVSESGKYLAYSTAQPDIHICKVQNNMNNTKTIHTLTGYDKVILLNITPDDKLLVGSFEKYRVVWSVETGEELHKLEGGVESKSSARLTTVITKQNIMLCGGCQQEWSKITNSIQAIDLETGQQLYDIKHVDDCYSLTFVSVHSSEKYFITGPSGSGIVNGIRNQFWTMRDVMTGKEVSKGSKEELHNPALGTGNLKMFGKDRLFIAVSLYGGRGFNCPVTIAYAGTVSQPLPEVYPFRYLHGHSDMILSLLVSPDESMMFSAGKDNVIKIWNLEKLVRDFDEEFSDLNGGIDTKKLEECEQQLRQNDVTSTCMKICRKSKYCFVGTSDGNLIVYDLEEIKDKLTCHIFDEPVNYILVSSTNKYVIAATLNGKICIWNIETCKVVHELKFKHRISCLDEGNNILIAGSCGMEGNGCIWNIETGEVIQEPQLLYSFYGVAMNPTGTKFVSSMFDFPIVCSVSPDSEEQNTVDMQSETMDSASFSGSTHTSFSRDGSLASCGSTDGALRIVTEKGQYIFRMQQKSTTTCAAFSVDGQYVVTGGYRSVYVWSITDGSLKYKLRNHTDFITNIKFDQTGQFMLTTSADNKIVLWDFKRGFSLASFLSYCPLDTIDFSPNAQYIVYSPGNVGLLSVLKPNPVLKQILEGNYCSTISSSLQGAQAVALSFSSQKILQNTKNSQACQIL